MQDIHHLINKYFDGSTSEQEEMELRDMLVSGKYSGEDVDEALAVMGYWAMKRREIRSPRKQRGAWAAAACVAVVLSVGAWIVYGMQRDRALESVAFVNGVEYTGEQAAELMHYQLGLLSAASQSVEETIDDDLSAFSDLLE